MQRNEVGRSAATAIHLRLRLLGGGLLVAHLLLVAWLTLRPLDVPWAAAANLTPLEGIRADLSYGPLEAVRRIGEGLALLAPLGVLLPLVNGNLAPSPLAAWSSLGRTAAAGALVSLSIEMLQSAVPGQVVDVDSVLLNGLGVVLAHAAVVPALRARLRRSQRSQRSQRSSQGSTPRIPRVGLGPWTDVLSAVPREY
ncbi:MULTISPECIES: VanZ family protein [unclassified Streptomyces]|uniref:VanZ family protein n=1 Tax=unclassified Streptomyces TaxID=2593676 RepID=UPI00224E2AE2|nr:MULTISPECIES: VanZ family protein [unclassified Streptomyces]MCX4627969.1 VanZ family protein [Streptomyces sp. NBC_01443]